MDKVPRQTKINVIHKRQTPLNYLFTYANSLKFGFIFFLSGEWLLRSRRYGRTAAMRLIVQPYDEDEDDDCPFPSNGAPVE
jgi:hypothetical protein